MTTENTETQNTTNSQESAEPNLPDYVAKQYRVVRIDDGWKTRKERIGAAWVDDKGVIMFRPTGIQVIEGDVYFYPYQSEPQQ